MSDCSFLARLWPATHKKCMTHNLENALLNKVKQLILLLDSEGICSSSDGKNSVCSAGDPGSILGQEDPMEKGMAPSLVFLPGEIHG